MLVPSLPFFFMVAGHETWRRICPLSFVSQIPRYLGWNRTLKLLSRRSGKVETQLALVAKGGFWQRHVWEIQFGLLFLALNARILFINADRMALGAFLLSVLALAFVTGLLWGGKTWCNYICPVAVVQKIYTEPRGGLFESQANTAGTVLRQSMCRTTTPAGDRSACVGCTVNCPDIDLERSYWENISNARLPYIYYGFFGLILGFYSWYYFYAGNWDYYFSGDWTHDPNQLGRLLQPGVTLGGHVYAIPVILSTPLILGAGVGIGMALGKLCETLYRWAATRARTGLSSEQIANRCMVFSAWLSINTFYLFGGRPNLMMLPAVPLHMVDALIVALTTIWFWRGIDRSPALYRREGLAASLLEQLRQLPVNIGRYLEGRKIDALSPDEIYILAKTLPGFSRDQRMRAYRNILREALRKGAVSPASSLDFMREMRAEVGVTDDEHREALQDLELDGAIGGREADETPATIEDWFRVESYQRWLEPLLVARFGKGKSLARILEEIDAIKSVDAYRAIYQISQAEHESAVGAVAGRFSLPTEQQARSQLDLLAGIVSLIFGLKRKMLQSGPESSTPSRIDWPAIGTLMIANARRRASAHYRKLFTLLINAGDSDQARALSARIARLSGADIEEPLAQQVAPGAQTTWAQSLPPSLLDLLRGSHPVDREGNSEIDGTQPLVIGGRPLLGAPDDLASALAGIVVGADTVLGAVALVALSDIDPARAREVAAGLPPQAVSAHDLMAEAVEGLIGGADRPELHPDAEGLTLFILSLPEGRQYSFVQDRVSIGSSPANDIVVEGPTIAPRHAVICRAGSEVKVTRADPGATIVVNGTAMGGDGAPIQSGARLQLSPEGAPGPVLVAEWALNAAGVLLEPTGHLRKLLWLSESEIFQTMGLHALANIADLARVWLCGGGTWLCRRGDPSRELLVLTSGAADVFTQRDEGGEPAGQLGRGALIDAVGMIDGTPHRVSVRISSAEAYVLTIDGLQLRGLMEQDSRLSFEIIGAMAAASMRDKALHAERFKEDA
jgi:hypothetical protein